jgi:hypothetical protein
MTAPQLKLASSLDTIWQESVYTRARLLAEAEVADLAPSFASFVTSSLEVLAEQRAHWEAELIAQAQVSGLDSALDFFCERIEKDALVALDMDRDNATFRRLFPQGLRAVTRLGLESQLQEVRSWPTTLSAAPLNLTTQAETLTDLITRGQAALSARADALAKTAIHRASRIEGLINDLNAARGSTYGELLKRASTLGLSKAWARSFFRS